MTTDIVIVGGGPSGLAAAYEAVGRGARAIVLERLDRLGGLARTEEFEGLLEALFADFKALRLSAAWDETVVPLLRAWAREEPFSHEAYAALRGRDQTAAAGETVHSSPARTAQAPSAGLAPA